MISARDARRLGVEHGIKSGSVDGVDDNWEVLEPDVVAAEKPVGEAEGVMTMVPIIPGIRRQIRKRRRRRRRSVRRSWLLVRSRGGVT